MSNPIKKSMVWLGLADDQFEYDEPAAVATVPIAPAPRGQVTPLPKRQTTLRAAPVVPMAPGLSEIVTVHPRQYRDAQAVAEHFREGTPVILNLSQMTEAEARRLVDFASGLSTGLRGKIERVTSKVFLLSPEHVATSGDQGAENELEAGFAE